MNMKGVHTVPGDLMKHGPSSAICPLLHQENLSCRNPFSVKRTRYL